MSLARIWIIFKRELLDTIRDRRTIVVMIIVPLLLMPIFMFLPGYLMRRQLEGAEVQLQRVGVTGWDNAPSLIDSLKSAPGIELVEVDDPSGALVEERVDVSLLIPDDYEELLKAGQSVQLVVYFDGSRSDSNAALDKVQGVVSREKERLLKERLARFQLSQDFLTPVTIETKNTASREKMGGMIMSMFIPMLIAIWASIGGMYTVIDATAGEKERRTLEPLLISPASREEIVIGKWAAVLLVSLISVSMVIISMLVTVKKGLPYLLGDMAGGELAFAITPGLLVAAFGGAILLSAFMSAVMMAVSLYARSFKEAQTYISPITFLVVIPGMALQFLQGMTLGIVYYAVPIFNILLVMKDAMLGQVDGGNTVLALISTGIYAMLALWVAILIFKNERVIFRD